VPSQQGRVAELQQSEIAVLYKDAFVILHNLGKSGVVDRFKGPDQRYIDLEYFRCTTAAIAAFVLFRWRFVFLSAGTPRSRAFHRMHHSGRRRRILGSLQWRGRRSQSEQPLHTRGRHGGHTHPRSLRYTLRKGPPFPRSHHNRRHGIGVTACSHPRQ
jgi:hypothetical protein